MTLSLKHAKTSSKSDGVDTSFIQPSDWNAEHTITAAQYTLLGRGTGAGVVSDLPQDDVGVPLGVMLDFTGPSGSVPGKYLLGFGQFISRTTYADYFALVGTTYGTGDGSTTFTMPDLRGRTTFGIGNMGGTESSRLNTYIASTLGAVGGSQNTSASVSGSGSISGSTSGGLTVSGSFSGNGSYIGGSLSAAGSGALVCMDAGSLVGVSGSISGTANGALGVGGSCSITGSTGTIATVPPGMALNKMVKVLR